MTRSSHRRARAARRTSSGRAVALSAVLALGVFGAAGCVPPQLLTLRSGLDSLRTVVDTLVVRDSIAYRVIEETRGEIARQNELLLSSRAASGTSSRELMDQMARLESRLDEVMGRFQQISQRVGSAPPSATGPDPAQLYDQSTRDLTQGRYAFALAGFRDYVRRFPSGEHAQDAQYGAAECLYAQARYDSALVEYGRVEPMDSGGARVPPALYKRALCEERLGREADARKTLEELVRRFPLSGEAQLARERLSRTKR